MGINRIVLKNNSTEDFSYSGNITLTTASEAGTYSVTTKNAYEFSAKAGTTEDIFRTYFRDGSDTLLADELPNREVVLTIEFGNDYYIEHKFNLRMQDFTNANCQ